MSHELRTPLNAILGFAQVLAISPQHDLSEMQEESISHILDGGQHLLTLINEVLELSRVESGAVEIATEPVDLSALLEECLPSIRTIAAQQSIEVRSDLKPTELGPLLVDPLRLKQVLLNLLSNAVKYNREGGSVLVSAEPIPGHYLRLRITDTGVGIPEAAHNIIFDSFTRLEATKTDVGGTGVGLAIAKQLVELMGGSIGVESSTEQGSTFRVDLPLAQREELPGAGVTRSRELPRKMLQVSDDLKPRKILYVEDNKANIALMKAAFEVLGSRELLIAETAEAGIEMANTLSPDLILMDIGLPGMDGVAAANILKASVRTRDIPVIAISAAAMKSDVERAEEAHFYSYLTKPIDVNETLLVIQRALDAASANQLSGTG